MPKFFHVDRERRLKAGDTIDLTAPTLSNTYETKLARALYPEGVSRWGAWILGDDPPLVVTLERLADAGQARATPNGHEVSMEGAATLRLAKDRMIEAVAEVVRLHVAPEKPSRLAAVYAYRDLETARDFSAQEGPSDAPIWRVAVPEGAEFHEADSQVFGIPDTFIRLLDCARLYWNGYVRPDSLPTSKEVLLPPPVLVDERVD